MKLGTFIVLVLCHLNLLAKSYLPMPLEARQLLSSLPKGAVTLEFVTQKAILTSDAYKALRSQVPLIEVAQLGPQAALDFNLDSGYTFFHSENEPDSPFGLIRMENSQWNLGFSKYFLSGTSVALTLTQGRYLKTFSPAFPVVGFDDIYKTTAELSIAQNLWRDGFGFATRKNQWRGKLEAEAKSLEIDESIEEWFFDLLQFFYKAWSAQSDVRAAQKSLARRQRLLNMTQKKMDHGTAERPDWLQVQSAVLGSQIRLFNAREILDKIWRDLVTTLKFPKHWGDIDPISIPMDLDAPMDLALNLCRQNEEVPSLVRSTSLRKIQRQQEAAELAYEIAKSNANPALSLNLIVGGNAVDLAGIGTTLSEASSLEHPHYSGILTFKLPLNNFQGKAELHKAFAMKETLQARKEQMQAQMESEWVTTCEQLLGWQFKLSDLKQIVAHQKQRVVLEESRFRLGRVPLMNVIQAGDEQTEAEINLHHAEVQMRLTAWKVKRLSGLIKPYLESVVKK